MIVLIYFLFYCAHYTPCSEKSDTLDFAHNF